MRIAVSASDANGIDSAVAMHFGRCPFYVLVDMDDMAVTDVTVVNNPFYQSHEPGAVPGFINEQGANVMLAGGMGGRAIQFFEQFGIEAVTGASGTVRSSLEQYFGGEISGAAPCAHDEGDDDSQ